MKASRMSGFTLIELVVFIVLIGTAAVGLIMSMRYVMPQQFAGATSTQATQIAQARMELVLAQRDVDAYEGVADPCVVGTPVAALCTNPLGFNVTVAGVSTALAWSTQTSAAYKLVTVTVKDSSNTRTLASVTSMMSNY